MRADANQEPIVKALRAIGCTVTVASQVGVGFPDLIVGRHGLNYLLEVKDGDKPKSKQKLSKVQQEFHDNWRGAITVVTTIDEAIRAVTSLAERSRFES